MYRSRYSMNLSEERRSRLKDISLEDFNSLRQIENLKTVDFSNLESIEDLKTWTNRVS